jgi:Tol biopolymer transport system component
MDRANQIFSSKQRVLMLVFLFAMLFLFAASASAATGTILYHKSQDIYMMNLTTGIEELVYAGVASDAYPVSSPDGSQIAFGCDAESARFQLWQMDSDGTNAVPAASNMDLDLVYPTDWVDEKILANAYEPWGSGSRVMMYDNISGTYTTLYSYSGRDCMTTQGILDDNWVLVSTGLRYSGGGFELLKVSSDGLQTTEVLWSNNAMSAGQGPSVSPDRLSVLFECAATPGDYSIYMMDLSDNSHVLMVENAWGPIWNETGDSFIFQRENNLWVSDLAGNEEQITFDGVFRMVGGWSEELPTVQGEILYQKDHDIYRMDLESGIEELILAEASMENYPVPSPDGGQIAFASDAESARLQLWFMGSDGSDPVPVASDLDYVRPNDWVGDKVLLNAYEPWGSGGSIWMYDTYFGNFTHLYSDPGHDCMAVNSILDDNWVIVSSGVRYGGGGYELLKVSSDGLGTTEVLWSSNVAVGGEGPSVSPDGTNILFEYAPSAGEDYNIYLFDLNDNSSTLMVQNAFRPIWNEAGDAFMFHRANDLWISNLAGNEVQITTDGNFRMVGAWTDGVLPPVQLTLTPTSDLTLPAEGGTLTYDAHLVSNLSSVYQGMHYWTNLILPNGNEYGPLSTQIFTLQSYMDVTVPGMTQGIPGYAPEGDYLFCGHVGLQPGPFVTDCFSFTKIGVAPNNTFDNWDANVVGLNTESTGSESIPSSYTMEPAYPNPFNPSTQISVYLPETASLQVSVMNVTGQQVAVLVDGKMQAGRHTLQFDASNLSSGLYFIHATVPGQFDQTQKVMLIQ